MSYLYRSAASFVASRAGIEPRGLIQGLKYENEDNVSKSRTGGLIIVGSYVPKTTTQWQHLIDNTDVKSVVISVPHIMNSYRLNASEIQSYRKQEFLDHYIKKVKDEIDRYLGEGKDVVLSTSREFFKGASLDDTKNVSDTIIQIIKSLETIPSFILSKGGITSQDVAMKGYGCNKAIVIGQIDPGVPVWLLNSSTSDFESNSPYLTNDRYIITQKDHPSNDSSPSYSKQKYIPYIVFPGNVGDESALTRVAKKLGVLDNPSVSNKHKPVDNLTGYRVFESKSDKVSLNNGFTNDLLGTLKQFKKQKKAVAGFNICELNTWGVVVHPNNFTFKYIHWGDLHNEL